MISIEDIRNPKRMSGFNHVGVTKNGTSPKPFMAQVYAKGPARQIRAHEWWGPCRAFAHEAAQDYCNYMNGAAPAIPAKLKGAGHQYRVTQINDPEYQAAVGVLRDFKAQRAGKQGYVYLITDSEYVKIGYSVNPAKRVAELQTGNARLLRILATMQGTPADESTLHARFTEHNTLQEWFEIHEDILTEFCNEHGHYITDHIKDNA